MRFSEIRLGVRLALADGRRSAIAFGLTALAVAIGTGVMLFAVSFMPAMQERDSRAAWRQPVQIEDSSQARLVMAVIQDQFGGQALVRVLLAPPKSGVPYAADAPVPPGLSKLPARGEAYVSPALADLLARTPADELAPRIGTVVGTIGPEGLRSPQELIAVTGADSAQLGNWARPIVDYPTKPEPHDLPPVAVLILVLSVVGALVPVAVFVATATRLAATRREQRLAALRLIGATPAQVARLAVVEALLYTGIGAPAGILIFALTRPLVAQIPLDGGTWWPETISPPLAEALALMIVVQVVGALAALAGMRRLALSPLGVQRRVTPPRPSALGLVPTLAGVVALVVSLNIFQSSTGEIGPLVIVGASFALIIIGIVFAGPWLTALVGRVLGRIARGPSALLAGRRLADDPRASFGSIAGVIMAVFVASAFFTFTAYATANAAALDSPIRPGVVLTVPYGDNSPADVAARLPNVRGVRSVLAVREVTIGFSSTSDPMQAWVVPCDTLMAAMAVPNASCGSAHIHTVLASGVSLASSYQAVTWDSQTGQRLPPVEFRVDPALVAPLVPDASRVQGLPDVIIDPAVFADAGVGFAVTRLYVTTDGAAASAERVRAAIQAADPTAWVYVASGQVSSNPQFAEVARIVGLGLIGSLLLAGCSLAVATMTGLLERRREYTFLRAAGMPVSRLRALVLLQAGVPLAVVSGFSALLGVGVAQVILRMATVAEVPLPDPSLAGVLGVSLAVAMAVVVATLPAVDGLTRPTSLRSE
jgi:cell division protein FtsX